MADARPPARVVSHTPGRIRVRLRQPSRHALHRVRTDLEQRPGIGHLETNARTGSVLVHYDRGALTGEQVLALLRDLGVVAREVAAGAGEQVPGTGSSTSATSLVEAVGDLDRRLSRLTGRRLDLKLLFPLTLGALGLRQALREGLGLNQVPAYVLLWYAFDSFWKFHSDAAPEAGAEATAEAHPAPAPTDGAAP